MKVMKLEKQKMIILVYKIVKRKEEQMVITLELSIVKLRILIIKKMTDLMMEKTL